MLKFFCLMLVVLFTHPNAFANNAYDFSGIVALDDCSGSIIRFATSQDDDHAMVLTNGHCLESGMPDAGVVITGQASSRSFSLMASDASTIGTLTASEVLYSTMTGTDITLYRLQETYADILNSYGIRPLLLSSAHPMQGTAIEVISGYWQRGYSCQIDGFVNELKEGDWTWKDSIRYSSPTAPSSPSASSSSEGCDVIGGTSGSPIVSQDQATGTRMVVGINNTINEDGEQCTVDNPCEVDANGHITIKQGVGYGQETYQIYTCVDANRDIDLTLPGCLLAKRSP